MRELVPRPLLERLRGGDRSGEFEASAALVDLAGFTETADALARHGDHGAEVLAAMVEAVFAPLLQAVYAHGGFVSTFAGDAFMAVFPGAREDAGPRALAAAHAIAASAASHGAFASAYGAHPVAGKVGAGAGTARWAVIAARDGSRASLYYAGSALANAVEAELAARPGDVIVHRSLAGLEPTTQAPGLPDPPAERDPLARLFCPDELLEADLPGEFRPLVPAFVAVTDPARLEAVVRDVFDLQHRYGGRIALIEQGDKGCLLLLVWGAPVSYEGDVARGLGLLLELHARHPGVLRSGATRGTAYTGFAGFPLREEYVAYSSHINLAARLMGAARAGELLVDREVAATTGGAFALRPLGRRTLKGIADPVEVHVVEGAVQRDAAAGPFVGRAAEHAALEAFLAPLARGRHAGTVVVAGDAGIGKSRLLAEQRSGFPGLWLRGGTDPVWRRELHPLRQAAAAVFGQSQHAGADANRERFLARLTPALAPHRDFLAALADLPDPGPAYEQASPAARFRGLLDAFSALMREQTAEHRVVLQVDDLQWADPETVAFLPELVAQLADRPFALLLTSREPSGVDADLTLELQPLDGPATAAMAQALLGAPAAPATVEWLTARTAGNPFFLEQTLLHVRERGTLRAGDDGLEVCGGDLVPPTVAEVVVARLDDLAADVRRTVQAAAVLGGEFDIPALERMLGRAPAEVAAWCEVAGRRGIWQTARRERRGRFHHELVRDAAYGTLLHASRTSLHATAAGALEDLHADRLEPQLHRLAHHHARGGRPDRAVDYERRAADHALRLGAYREAVECADTGLALVPRLPDGEQRRRSELALALALGAGRIVTDGQTAPATRAAYDRALALTDGLDESRETFQALFGLRTYYQFAGDHSASLQTSTRCLAVARRLDDPDLLIQGHLMVGNSLFWAGDLEEAEQQFADMRSLLVPAHHGAHLAGFAQDPRFTSVIPGALGAWLRGDAARAHALVDEALRDAQAVGHRFSEALVLQAAAFLACLEDRPADARRHAERLVAIAREEAFPVYVAIGCVQLGWAQVRLGDVERGLELLASAIATMRARGIGIGQTLLGLLLADAALGAGRRELAGTAAGEAIDIAEQIGERAFLAELHRLRALAAEDDGERAEHLETARAVARTQGAEAVAARIADPAPRGAS